MNFSSSTPSEVSKRPSGIILIAGLWVLTGIIVLIQGIDTLLFDLSFDPTAPELLDFSQYAREWLSFGVPVETVLMLSLFALSLLMILTAYGLYTATRWSYEAALASPTINALVNCMAVAFYASSPEELGWAIDVPLYFARAKHS